MDEVIIVDDSALNRMALTNILQDDYKVIGASSGKELFEILELSDPKLILLDVIMPELDGFEVIAKLKISDEYNKIPVIFITGLDDANSEEKGFSLGAIDYITKPFKANVVKARVKSYVKLYDFIRKTEMQGQSDGLTGLYNKKMTEEQIKKQLCAEPPLKNGALMIIDVDNFKSINDSFGHLYGDAVITQLGSSLRSIFQKSDILGRVGGDEFFVFLRNYKSTDVLKQRAKELCDEFRKSYEQNGITVNISASIGIATTDDSFDFEEIYKYADIALYSTKAKGKNGFTFYTGEEEINYKSNRTEIENSKTTNLDPDYNIKDLKDRLVAHMFNLVDGGEVFKSTIESILKMICMRFGFDKGYIAKLDFDETVARCLNNWISSESATKAEMVSLSFEEVAFLHSTFFDKNLIVSEATEHQMKYAVDQDNDKNIYIFVLKNKKAILGYIGFEKTVTKEKVTKKVIDSITNVCQQLSTVVVYEFLLENMLASKNNMVELINHVEDAIYVTKPEASKPLFKNKAAKNSDIRIHGKKCFNDDSCKECLLKEAVKNNGYYKKGNSICKAIKWTNGSTAYMVITKIPS